MKLRGGRIGLHIQKLLIGSGALLAIERWTLRDTRMFLAFVYYFGQPVMIAGLLLIAAVIAWRGRRRRVAIGTSLAALGFAGWLSRRVVRLVREH